MKIAVCMKQVPAKDAPLRINETATWVREGDISYETCEPDNFALEAALQLIEKHGGEVVVISLGPGRVRQVIKEGLAKGAARALHVQDDNFYALDPLQMAAALAGAVREDVVVVAHRGASGPRRYRHCARGGGVCRVRIDARPRGVQGDEPVEQDRVLCPAAREPLVQVVMSVDEARGDECASGVVASDRGVTKLRGGTAGTHSEDAGAVHCDVALAIFRAGRVDGSHVTALDHGDSHADTVAMQRFRVMTTALPAPARRPPLSPLRGGIGE